MFTVWRWRLARLMLRSEKVFSLSLVADTDVRACDYAPNVSMRDWTELSHVFCKVVLTKYSKSS